jgi:hypothetical protein
MDWSWIQNSNGMQATSNPQWLQLQLAAASLLFLAVQLPADKHPQFQMLVLYYSIISLFYVDVL